MSQATDELKRILKQLVNNIKIKLNNVPNNDEIKNLIKNAILEEDKKKYYIGKIILDTANINPATYLGFGTWQYWGEGRVPVGVDTNDSDFDTVEKTGGEKKHTQTINEMPAHNHQYSMKKGSGGWTIGAMSDGVGTANGITELAGGGQPFNIQQQYITCYMWKRVA